MKKRILALVLVLMLLITNLSLTAAAEESPDPESNLSGQQENNPLTIDDDGTSGNEPGGDSGSGNGGTGEGGSGDSGSGSGGTGEGGSSDSGSGNGGTGEGGIGDSGSGSGGTGESGSGDSGSGSGGTGEGGSDGSGSDGTGNASCNHVWVYVEIEPTCTEYGAKGYGCGLCGAVKDVVAVDKASHSFDNACDTSCNVCKATREIEHKFSTQWSKNSTKHWHACTVCGAKDGEGNHYPGPAATEEKAQYCLTCGLMMMPQKSHTHTYSKDFTSDETGHWYTCSGCDEKKDFQMHSYDNLCDPDCNDCGYTTQTAHSYAENWNSDEAGHWQVCVLCQEAKPAEAHIPGPEATDLTAQVCTVCGFELAPALQHTHTPADAWESDELSHWKTCACGEVMDKAIHNWDAGTEEDHVVSFVCMDCGAEKTEEIIEEESGFPWWILVIGMVAVMIGAVIALVVVLLGSKKKGKFNK